MPERRRTDYMGAVDLSNIYHPAESKLDLDDSINYTFVLVNGAFKASHWTRFGRLLESLGHTVIEPMLPTDDPQTSFEDDAEAVQEAIKDPSLENIVFMPHSRGIETGRIFSAVDLSRFAAIQIVSSGGPHSYTLPAMFPEAQDSRYSSGYAQAPFSIGDGLSRIKPKDAVRYLFDDIHIENGPLAVNAADSLLVQRQSEGDTSSLFKLPTDKIPTNIWLGVNDSALNIPRAYRVFEQWACITPDLIESGHTPQLSIPHTMARYAIDFANRAYKDPGPLLTSD